MAIDYTNILISGDPLTLYHDIPCLDNNGREQTRRKIFEVKELVTTPEAEYNQEYKGLVITDGSIPTGTDAHRFSWERSAGSNVVHLNILINFPTAGSGISYFKFPVPDTCPIPMLTDGLGMIDDILFNGVGSLQPDEISGVTGWVVFKVDSTGDWYEIICSGVSGAYRMCSISLIYFAMLQGGSSS